MIKTKINIILKEVKNVLSQLDEKQVLTLAEAILSAKKVVTVGAGRMGMASKAFAMRLSHMGFNAFTLGDSNLPRIGSKDLLLVASGSGETQTIYDLVSIAKSNSCRIALITTNLGSRMAKIADMVLKVKAPSKVKKSGSFKSVQPMTTLNEQSLWLFYDALTLILMEKCGIFSEQMWEHHSILE